MSNAFLATIVLGLFSLQFIRGLRRNVREEFSNPLAELTMLDSIGDDGERRLGIGGSSILGNRIGGEVLLVNRRGRVERLAEAAVESEAVRAVSGQGKRVCKVLLLAELNKRVNLLIENVS